MITNVIILPQARAELYDQAEYISTENVDLARRFLSAANSTIAHIAEFPGLGRLRDFRNKRLKGLRSRPIQGFENWLIFYLVTEETLEVIHVLHGARGLEALFDEQD